MPRQFFISVCLVLYPALAFGQSISAVWDPSPPSDEITSYEVCISTTSLSCNIERATVPANETSYTFVPTPGVLYRVAVRALNAAGAGAYSPEVSASVPSLAQPANQTSTVNLPITALQLSASDPDGSTLNFTHSGLPFGLSLNASTGRITGTPTSTGTFNVTVFVSDNLETTPRSFVWTVQPASSSDTTAPALSVTSHTTGQTVTTASITLSGTASDSGNGGNGVGSVTVNGASATGGTATGNNTASWSRSVTLSTGANTLTVVATDTLGNARTVTLTITRQSTADTTAPTLSVTSHTSGQSVTASSITLSGTASDSGAGGSGIASVTVNGTAAAGGTASGNGTASWSRSVSLSTGANALTVVATDGAGNARTSTLSITRTAAADTTAPTLTITSHSSGQAVSSPVITLAGTATDSGAGGNGIASVTVNGSPASGGTSSGNSSASWSRALTLNTGANVITVVATDGAGNARTTPITLVGPTSPMSTVSMTVNRTSPQPTGTPMTLTGGGSGGSAPYSFKWWVQRNGGAWTQLQDWTTTPMTWTPTQSGSYVLGVWGRAAGATADVAQAVGTASFTITGSGGIPPTPPSPGSPTMSSASVSADLASPRSTGTSVTFTASGTGGTAPYSFKWWMQRNGGVWTEVSTWSTTPTWTWTPTQSGNYVIGIWGRSAGNSTDTPQAIGVTSYVITGSTTPPPPPPVGVVPSATIAAGLASPRPAGTTVEFTTSVNGGTAPHSFKYWIQKDGGPWTMVRDWSTSAAWNWTAGQTGNYVIGVWVRNAGAVLDTPQTIATLPFVIAAAGMPTSSLAASSNNVRVGTPVTLTAGATGGVGPHSFKWWVQRDGGAWTEVQGWSTTTTFAWTPTSPGIYVFGIWGRNAGVSANAAQTISTTPIVVSP